ncbi:MAG TPA: ABC transporter permease [Terracidiphilus sp.]|jgi:putative ABC transport system permease protein|nr:ABC transporter permease [Terracidiphilus sp.]
MRKLRAWWLRVFRATRTHDEAAAELESHIEMHTEEGIRSGLSPQEARRRAHVRLGGVEQVRQALRERNTLPWLENTLRDVRYALRGIRRNPLFAFTVIATLALGIGATTAVFSVVDRILFRSLPYAHADRLVSFGLSQPLEKQEFTLGAFFYEWRDNQRPFESVTFERGVDECNLTENNPVHLHCGSVAGNFLSVLGVPLQTGRTFLPEEDEPKGPAVAILSDGLWLSRFNRDPQIVGKTLQIDEHSVRIVGVLPRNFEMPRLQSVDLLMPAQVDRAGQNSINAGLGLPLWAFARLKPGVSVAEAEAQMVPLFKHTQLWIPAQFRNDFHLMVRSVRDRQMQDAYAAARILLGAVFAVLLIACANVGSLFAARAARRMREMAVRSALGASRARLIRQNLAEAVLFACAGALCGCLLAQVLLRTFVALAPTGIPFLEDARIDARILGFVVLLALLCAVICGAMQAVEKPRAESLVTRVTLSRAHVRLRRALVTAQIAASIVLLVGASLLVRSFRNLEAQNLGMSTHNVLSLRISVTAQRYPTPQTFMDFYLRTEAALRQVPGIEGISISDSVPPDADSWHDRMRSGDIFPVGKPHDTSGAGNSVVVRTVTPSYFKLLQIPIVEGRNFTEAQRSLTDSPLILSRQLALRLFPGEDPVGKHIQFGDYLPYFSLGKTVYTVVGVAGDVKNAGLTGDDSPELYKLRTNHASDWTWRAVILIDTQLPPSTVAPWIRGRIAQIDPMAPVEITPLSTTVAQLADRPRFETALLSFFALCGLAMAIIGLYGVIAFIAVQRTQEIGVRMALGASRSDILRLIAGEGVRLILIGGVLGLASAFAAAQLLRSLLFSVSPHDPASFVAVTVLLSVVALAAALIPARSAMKTNPMNALRCD